MGLLSKLLGLGSKRSTTPVSGAGVSAGATARRGPVAASIPSLGRDDDGAFVDGKPTFHWADVAKDDLTMMLRCCEAELEAMVRTKLAPAPFYFERAAVLSRQAQDYAGEIAICERYFKALEAHYAHAATKGQADVRKGPKYLAMVKRRDRARELLTEAPAAPKSPARTKSPRRPVP